jgi:hypothetical protein
MSILSVKSNFLNSILIVKFNFPISILTVLRSTNSILTVNTDFPISILIPVEVSSSDRRNEDPLLQRLERAWRRDIRSNREHLYPPEGQMAQDRDHVFQLRLPLDQR